MTQFNDVIFFSLQVGAQTPVRTIAKKDYSSQSAALLAAIGLSLSGFSLKQMASKSPKKF